MAEPFIGEIRIVGFNFAPRGWATCDGQLMAIAQNTALFSLLGTMYGGNGVVTFGLPDLRGRLPMHTGQGPGLTPHSQGEFSGTEYHTLSANQMPPHSHSVAIPASSAEGQVADPSSHVLAAGEEPVKPYGNQSNTSLAPFASAGAGGGQPVSHMPPYLCVLFVIALEGIYPSRN